MLAGVKFSSEMLVQLARRPGSARVPVKSGSQRSPPAPRGAPLASAFMAAYRSDSARALITCAAAS
jgi:hypothetical protein